ncbi:Pleckstrin homology domain-containing protein [Gautieria morchelliformis]|nr:Pleckstrin homology domain-containing protein [Gautieria morchelliformis]
MAPPTSWSRFRSSSTHRQRSSSNSSAASFPHPYASMPPAPLPVVSSRDPESDEEECPVCLEPLSFSFRLPGEKPHIVPECGHALHEACFVAVYGPPRAPAPPPSPAKPTSASAAHGRAQLPRHIPRPQHPRPPHRAPQPHHPARPHRGRPPRAPPGLLRPLRPQRPPPRVPLPPRPLRLHHRPSITVKPEFPSITRNSDPAQPLTCIVTIELPSRRPAGHVPGPVLDPSSYRTPTPNLSDRSDATTTRRPASPDSLSSAQYAYNPTPARHQPSPPPSPSPFQSITDDLRARIIDWKSHPLSGLGPLQMFDLLSVRRDALIREFYVYLFKEAIICVIEEKKRSLGRLLTNAGASSVASDGSASATAAARGVLRLKGRIYIRHIKQVTETSVKGELSLTIDMEDARLESFILIFRERESLETWRARVTELVLGFQREAHGAHAHHAPRAAIADTDEFGVPAGVVPAGVPSKAQRMLSGSTGTGTTTASDVTSQSDSLLAQGSSRSTMSSASHGSRHHPKGDEYPYGAPQYGSPPPSSSSRATATPGAGLVPTGLMSPHLSAGPSNSLPALPHTPLDLILVLALPPPTAAPSTALLKQRVIKTSLDFVVASLGARDRLSIVTFEVGMGGRVRRTPFLAPGRAQGAVRLARFIDAIGRAPDDNAEGAGADADAEFGVRTAAAEKTDVVTAVNHGLDVVLQRKARNPISGMMLVSDAADSTRRAQMDLVLARAEAANVPIHSFGYGRSHDPASLWLMSNHTAGTYTFVKDWYDLRDCLAGCLGGMMSIGLVGMKLHMKVVDARRFRMRKVSGGPSSIVASAGIDVDVDVGELRYGERKEMLVELELDNTDAGAGAAATAAGGAASSSPSTSRRGHNATERYVASMGLDLGGDGVGDGANLVEGMMEDMIDEVPVFEVDGVFFDPAAGKHVSRLAHPVLLTVTLVPASSAAQMRSPALGVGPAPASDPVIVRRRMELLASEMITRALVLVSRKNAPQAQKILSETRRILHTVLQNITQALPPPAAHTPGGTPSSGVPGATVRTRREALTLGAVRALQALLADIQALAEGLRENVALFAHDQRNFGAQQAMILRGQRSWTGRTMTEKLFWTIDNSIELVTRSTDWVARE